MTAALAAVVAFLRRASVWQLIAMALAALVVWQAVRIDGLSFRLPLIGRVGIIGLVEQRDNAKAERDAYKRTLDRLVKESKQKQGQVERVIVKYRPPDVEKIEKAPLPGNCQTPPEILGADL